MAKKNTLFFCKECGFETSGWMGKCPGCNEWNTLIESTTVTGKKSANDKSSSPTYSAAAYSWTASNKTVKLKDAGEVSYTKQKLGIPELDEVLGGGLTVGSITLVGGEPGIGKSTLLLQMADKFQGNILYVSGEESPSQINMRAKRLGVDGENITICAQTSFEVIAQEMLSQKPGLCIIDSIQTLYSENVNGTPGSVSQTREVTAGLVQIAKTNNMSIILVGHVTKDGNIAGPKTIEHMVDTVLYFEGDNTGAYRILRTVKNRFGKSGEIAFFEMTQSGLIGAQNGSSLLVSGRPINAPGSALTATVEGSRAITIEIQALLTEACYGNPQRMVTGLDRNRVSMLLAVCEKNFKLGLPVKDCFINVIGGLKITDPACDLSIVAAIISSAKSLPIKSNSLIIGEVGLTGELRPVSKIQQRVSECSKLGIKTVILPSSCKATVEADIKNSKSSDKSNSSYDNIGLVEYIYVDNLNEAADVIFS